MKTSYFWKATHEPTPNAHYISISRQNLRGAEQIPKFEPLLPSWELIRKAHEFEYSAEYLEFYKAEYFSQLARLNVSEVYEQLKDCTLLCFESPKDLVSGKKFCHRRMVAGWIEEELGIVVPEDVREKDKPLIVPAICRPSTQKSMP